MARRKSDRSRRFNSQRDVPKTKLYSQKRFRNAVFSIINGKSYGSAARIYNISKSVLWTAVHGKYKAKTRKLSVRAEKSIHNYLVDLERRNIRLTVLGVRRLFAHIAENDGISYKNKLPHKNVVRRFLEKYNLKARIGTAKSTNSDAVTHEHIEQYFDVLREKVDEYNAIMILEIDQITDKLKPIKEQALEDINTMEILMSLASEW